MNQHSSLYVSTHNLKSSPNHPGQKQQEPTLLFNWLFENEGFMISIVLSKGL